MNSKRLICLVPALMLAFALIPLGYAQDPPIAQLSVTKSIIQIDYDGVSITDGAEITAFLDNVPNYTQIVFTASLIVANIGEADITEVVVTDHFGAELDVACGSATVGTCEVDPRGKAADRLKWEVGDLAAGDSAELFVTATTNVNPGGYQRYTSCGLHYFNSGPVAKGKVEKANGKGMRQISDDGDYIELTVSNLAAVELPQCSNCIDDDDDGYIDYGGYLDAGPDLDCESPSDDNEAE